MAEACAQAIEAGGASELVASGDEDGGAVVGARIVGGQPGGVAHVGDGPAAGRQAVGVAVQAEGRAVRPLQDPGLAAEDGRGPAQPAHQGQKDGVGGRLDEDLVLLDQVPALAGGVDPGKRLGPPVADPAPGALFPGAQDGVAQPVGEAFRGPHLLRRDHGHAVGLELGHVVEEVVGREVPHQRVEVRRGVVVCHGHAGSSGPLSSGASRKL